MFERTAPEQYDSLPDIPDPAENPHLVGHEEARETLAKAYRAGRLHHALLISGPRGIGKATLAFKLAHHLSTYPEHEAAPEIIGSVDPQSRSFRLGAQGAHPGILHLTRPYVERDKKFKTAVTVEEVRRVSRFLSLTQSDGGYRVVIVDSADDMNTNAANALLKNLEEPPTRTLFVLIAHSLGRLLPTIRSRCQVIRLQSLGAEKLEDVLHLLGATLSGTTEENRQLLKRSGGSVRNAVLLTQFGGIEIAETLERIISGRQFDVGESHRLADAVSGRDRQVQFDIFSGLVLDQLEQGASLAAKAGETARAGQLAALWEEMAGTVRQAEIYNLDKKQHAIATLRRLHETTQNLMAA